jgi:hypothetical protein
MSRSQIRFDTDPEQVAAVEREAKRRGISKASLLRLAVYTVTGAAPVTDPYPYSPNRGGWRKGSK